MSFEVRVDCPLCLVEGSRIETWCADSASCRLGVPESVRCRLCGHVADGHVFGVQAPAPGLGCPGCGAMRDGAVDTANECFACGARSILVDRVAATPFAELDALERALERWAREEGLVSASDLVEAYFVASSSSEVLAALERRERIETTFDVSDYLFSGGAGGGGVADEPPALRRPPASRREEGAPSTERAPMPVSLRPIGGPREELLALASVAAADGEASADDLAMLARSAQTRGLAPPHPTDIRVWRPNEIAPPSTLVDRERVLEEMFQIGWADGQMDDSELRVIRDFARAWGIDPERLREWTELYSFGDSNWVERWFRRIGFFLFPSR